jgi:catechol 2,3-dioxygenase-like lactoylglutathione lyase family enzyme
MTFDARELQKFSGQSESASTPAVIGFNGTGITVKSLKKSLHFYVDIIGYTVIGPPKRGKSAALDRLLELDGADYTIATVRPPGAGANGTDAMYTNLIEVTRPKLDDNTNPFRIYQGRVHTGTTVEDADTVFAQLKAEGIEAFSPMAEGTGTQKRVAYMLDPDGAIFEILGNPPATS